MKEKVKKQKSAIKWSILMIILSALILYVLQIPAYVFLELLGISAASAIGVQLIDALSRIGAAIFVLVSTYLFLDKKYDYQFNKNNLPKWLLALIPSIIMFIVVFGLVFTLKFEGKPGLILSPKLIGIIIFQSFCVSFYEEIVFRGLFLQSILKSGKKNAIVKAVLATALFFGFIHLAGGLAQTLNALISGVFMIVVYLRTKNIWISILDHAIWNSAITMIGTPVENGEVLLLYASNTLNMEGLGPFDMLLGVLAGNYGASGAFLAAVGTLAFVLPVVMMLIGLFLIRKRTHAEIKELWGLTEATSTKLT